VRRIPDQSEIVADQVHEFGVEAGLLATDRDLERWIWESRSDSEYSRLEREF